MFLLCGATYKKKYFVLSWMLMAIFAIVAYSTLAVLAAITSHAAVIRAKSQFNDPIDVQTGLKVGVSCPNWKCLNKYIPLEISYWLMILGIFLIIDVSVYILAFITAYKFYCK